MVIDFLKTAANLKKISRQGWIDKLSINDPESVADHTYSMAIMGMVLSDLKNYDTEKILKMVLLHDLAEAKIGDYTPNQLSKENKIEIENNTFNEIIEKLPGNIKSNYSEIWKEYQDSISKEAMLVHQIDRLEMALQAKVYQKEGHSTDKLNSFFEYAKKDIVDPTLKELFTKIVDE